MSPARILRLLVIGYALFCPAARCALADRIGPERVLVVANAKSADSKAVAEYYVGKRRIPRANLLRIECPDAEVCTIEEFRKAIRAPIRKRVREGGGPIDFVVLTRGIPLKIQGGASDGFCVDSLLTTLLSDDESPHLANPYFGANTGFTRRRFPIFLVTRLDGATRGDATKLVDRSLAAKPAKGPFLLVTDPARDNPSYGFMNDGMRAAARALKSGGFRAYTEMAKVPAGASTKLAGYFSWGSNDSRWSIEIYRSLGFVPGALAETAVSTSGRTLHDRNAPGQSLVSDLIAQGVTGCKGYVSEPYADSMALANVLFARYVSGYSLAESFYMASRWLRWKDVVIGDPICAPYSQPAGRGPH